MLIKRNSTKVVGFVLGFFIVISFVLMMLNFIYPVDNSIYFVFSLVFFMVSVGSFWTNTFPKIILSDFDLNVKTLWPFGFPNSYTFPLDDIEALIITRTKYLSAFLSGDANFDRIIKISKDTTREMLFRKQKLFDRELVIARNLQFSLYGEDYWICIKRKNGELNIIMIDDFSEKKEELLILSEKIKKKESISVYYKLELD